jgi:hypothetical protein
MQQLTLKNGLVANFISGEILRKAAAANPIDPV